MKIYSSVRRRFSSNASSIASPRDSNEDGRRPTLPAIIPAPANRPETEPLTMIETPISLPVRPSVRIQSQSSHYVDAPEYQHMEDEFFHPCVDDMALLQGSMGSTYPLERQQGQYVHFSNDSYAPPSHIHASYYQEPRERPMRRLSRQVSGLGRQASIVGRHARALPGTLGRRASKLLRMNTAQDLVRPTERGQLFDEKEWHIDLGREIHEHEDWRTHLAEQEFRKVTWSRSLNAT